MSNKQESVASGGQKPPIEQAAHGGFWRSIIEIFTNPFRVFARIDAGLTWWKPAILVCAVAMALYFAMTPLERRLVEVNPQGLSEEQLQKAVEQSDKLEPVGLIALPIVMIISLFIMAGIAHLVINAMSAHQSYKKTLGLLSYCSIITMLEQIIATVVLRMRGLKGVESQADLKFSLSLAPLLGNEKGFLAAVLQNLSIFQIWYYIVLIIGIASIFKIARKAAIVPAFLIWLIGVIMLWIGWKFSGGMV